MAKVSDEKLLELLLVGGGVSGASAASGLSKAGIYKRLQDPDFRSRYDCLQGTLLAVTAGSMADAIGSAVQALRNILDDPETSAGVRVSAADSLLRHANRYIEAANILRRLEALEAAE